MEITFLKTAVSKIITAARPMVFQLKKHAPEILVITGTVSVAGGTVLCCKATLDAKEKLSKQMPMTSTHPESVSDKDGDRQFAMRRGADVVVGYLPGAGLVIGGVAMLIAAKSIEHRRFTAILGAYSSMQAAFDEYRARVEREIGRERELDIFNDAEHVKVDVLEDLGDGKKPKKSKEEIVVFNGGENPYHRIFDECNAPTTWYSNLETNRFFLECEQKALNMMLQTEGRVFLNDVYKRLGFDYCEIGQFVGWLADDIEGSKDGYIDFGIDYAAIKDEIAAAQAEKRRPEPSIWLTFNCDGEIWDKPLKKRYDI
jgi:hypothetical protein